MLRKDQLEIRKKLGVDGKERAVVGEALALAVDVDVCSQRKRLVVKHQPFDRVLLEQRNPRLGLVRLLRDIVIHEALEVDERIEGGNRGSGSQRRGYDAARAGSGSAGAGAP